MPKNESPNWKHALKLELLAEGLHTGYPFKQGYPENTSGTFTIVTAWGEWLTNVRIIVDGQLGPIWDVSQCKGRSDVESRVGKQKNLHEGQVAGWKKM